MKIINEMAMSRADAVDRCISLGTKFVEHFHKIYSEADRGTKHHHASEMQGWLDQVTKILIKPNSKKLNVTQCVDWFFVCGSSTEELFDNDDELEKYEKFYIDVVGNNDVLQSLKDVGLYPNT